jgi:hypothetical protein
MTKVEALKRDVQNLTQEELTKFRKWFSDYDNELWDRQIEGGRGGRQV